MVNAAKAPQIDFPFSVPLLLGNLKSPNEPEIFDGTSYYLKGSGVVIARNWLLTASHCIRANGASRLLILLGSDELNPGKQEGVFVRLEYACFDLESPKCSAETFEAGGLDLALVRFSAPANAQIATATLEPTLCDSNLPVEGTLVAWGKTEKDRNGDVYPRHRRAAEFRLSSKPFDAAIPSSDNTIFIDPLFGTNSYPAPNDSGGPLMINHNGEWFVRGIHKGAWRSGDDCPVGANQAHIIDLAPYRDLIMKSISDEMLNIPPK